MSYNIHGRPVGVSRLAKHLRKGFANNVLGLKLNLCQSSHFFKRSAVYYGGRCAYFTFSQALGLKSAGSKPNFQLFIFIFRNVPRKFWRSNQLIESFYECKDLIVGHAAPQLVLRFVTGDRRNYFRIW